MPAQLGNSAVLKVEVVQRNPTRCVKKKPPPPQRQKRDPAQAKAEGGPLGLGRLAEALRLRRVADGLGDEPDDES